MNELNPIAEGLNETIKKLNPHIYEMLSDEGKRIYMPRGILSQTAEAKFKKVKHNATIGMATENKKPMYLECVYKHFNDLALTEVFPYAPSTGVLGLREYWKEYMYEKNPSLSKKEISLPVTTIGLTHAITITSSLFINPNDTVLVPDKMWGNYKLIMKERKQANLMTYRLFDENLRLDVKGIKETFTKMAIEKSKLIIVLNFPNNPTGYSPTKDEAREIIDTLKKLPEYDCNLILVFDDAYFGLFYEDDAYKESMFAEVACSSEKILAIKGDAATKEEFVWGFRVGFLTFATKTDDPEELYGVIENKASGVIRGTVSNPPQPIQNIILKALKDDTFYTEKDEKSHILMKRYMKVKEIVHNKKYSDEWDVYPFNSGYFMCLRLKNIDPEKLRHYLLDNYSLGIISLQPSDIRIAFSCLEIEEIEEVFEIIYKAIKELSK